MPSKDLKTKVYWQSGCHPVLSLFKLMEIERLGNLKNVKYCIIEFGYQTESSMNYCSLNSIYYSNFSYSWRYFSKMPWNTWLAVDELLRKNAMGKPSNSPLSETTLPLTERTRAFVDKQVANVIPQHFDYINNPSPDMVKEYRKKLENTFLEINDICRRNGVKLIVISAPLSSWYRKEVPAEAELIKKNWIKWMGLNQISYLDMTESMPDSSFVESHHLLSIAREDFTKKLLDRINECTFTSDN